MFDEEWWSRSAIKLFRFSHSAVRSSMLRFVRRGKTGYVYAVPYIGMPSLAPHPSAFLLLFTLRLFLFSAVRFRPHRSFLCERRESTFLVSVVHLGVHLIGSRPPLLTSRRLRRLSAMSMCSLRSGIRPVAGGRGRGGLSAQVADQFFAGEGLPAITSADGVFHYACGGESQQVSRAYPEDFSRLADRI